MLGESHDLIHEFPEYKEKIIELRQGEGEFSQLMQEYDDLDVQIRDLEMHDQPVADEYMEDLKKQRVALKDRLYEILAS